MKYSLKLIQEHLDQPLPKTEELVHTITIKSFEVEGEEKTASGDTILEMKVLPDRAHDALSHRGMAREIAALFALPRKERVVSEVKTDTTVAKVLVKIEDEKLCPRYIGVRVDGVTVETSPEWLATKISSIGGRSISNIVDLTNFVLFDIGQPMHAFDAKKVVGGITVRLANAGETMTTLDNKEVVLEGSELVIADDEGVLALAGIKGGKKAEVDSNTTSVIFESANFDSTLTRKTSTKHGIKTDASKRYENGMTSEFALEGMKLILSELAKLQPTAKIGEMTDVYPNPEKGGYQMQITIPEINHLLGSSMTEHDFEETMTRLEQAGLTYAVNSRVDDSTRNVYVINIPNERLDLRIKQDLIEEIGRHYGYDKIDAVLPKLARRGVLHKRMYYANKVRNFLVERGYSEVFTYSFAVRGEGEVEVLNPVGKDRPFMRNILSLWDAITMNVLNAPLLEIKDVRLFEFGNIFKQTGEEFHLAIGVQSKIKKIREEMTGDIRGLLEDIGVLLDDTMLLPSGYDGLGKEKWEWSYNFDELIEKLPEPIAYETLKHKPQDVSYQTLSPYPFIVRDIAIFVPQEVTEEYVEKLLKKEAGGLVVRFSQFDKFQKAGEDRISYAYRMVFQSFERTLTDDEINAIMTRVTALCNAEKDWQVR